MDRRTQTTSREIPRWDPGQKALLCPKDTSRCVEDTQTQPSVRCNAGRQLGICGATSPSPPTTLTQEEPPFSPCNPHKPKKQPPTRTYLAQGDGASGQANESPFPAVGVLGERELLRQDLDHVFDLRCVVLSHKLSHQPGERRGKHPGGALGSELGGLGSPQPSETGIFGHGKRQRKQYRNGERRWNPQAKPELSPSSPLTANSGSPPPCCSQPAASCAPHGPPAQGGLPGGHPTAPAEKKSPGLQTPSPAGRAMRVVYPRHGTIRQQKRARHPPGGTVGNRCPPDVHPAPKFRTFAADIPLHF